MGGPAIGCIADDFTGATDVGSTLAHEGLDVVVTVGPPDPMLDLSPADAVVVALKTRTAPVDVAIERSAAALRGLRAMGAAHVYFKYCSTFDSRPDGNIGPVADRLLDDLGATFTVACPAFPETGRTVYQGHLFVGDRLLSESPMARHPLTPMTDSDVVRLLARQTRRPVGLVPHGVVARGARAVRGAFDRLRDGGVSYAVVDALDDRNLRELALAAADLELATGASGLARGLPTAYGVVARARARAAGFQAPDGPAAVIAGSVSAATREQVVRFGARASSTFAVDPRTWDDGAAGEIASRAVRAASNGPVLVHAAHDPDAVVDAQRSLGADRSAAIVESALAALAVRLVEGGITRLVVAGGETSAAVVAALAIRALRIGPDIAPGVPWCRTIGRPEIAVALKSGNFGGRDFFADALAVLT